MLDWLKGIFSAQKTVARQVAEAPSSVSTPLARVGSDSVRIKEQGDAFMRQGNLGAAANSYRQAIALDPNYAKAHSNLGFVLMQQGLSAEAEKSLKRALALDPTNGDTYFMLGNLVIPLRNDLALGCEYLQKAVELLPDFDIAYLDWRRYMALRGQLEQVKGFLIAGIEKYPDRPDFHNFLGDIYQNEQHFDLAITCFEKALAMRPDDAGVLENLGFALFKQGFPEQATAAYASAVDCLRQAVTHAPGDPDAHCKLATLLYSLNRHEEALASFNQVLELSPEYHEARIGRGMTSLITGHLESGWRDTRDIANVSVVPHTGLTQALWLNDARIEGKTILLNADQGLGDTIQFARYAEKINALGAKVYIRVEKSLKSLFETLHGVEQVFGDDEILPAFDYQCPLSNVRLAFNTTIESIPANIPYLRAATDRSAHWAKELSDKAPRIGVVWSGNPLFRNDKYRSIHLQRLSALLMNGKRHFFLLQKVVRAIDAPFVAGLANVTDLSPQLSNFAETAAVIANLDLVITVDTSVAHLAGALGKPV